MRKYLIVLGTLLICNLSFGALYPTNFAPKIIPKPQTNYRYTCNWPYYPAIQSLLRQLKFYHVTSIAYSYQLRLVIPDYMLFNPGSNELNENSKKTMSLVLSLLSYLPGAKIIVMGYSDNVAAIEINNRRSLLNSQKIAGILWSNGYPATSQTLDYSGAGESNPINDNSLINGLANNRRVEIMIDLPH